MSVRAIQNLERGERRPYPDTTQRPASALQHGLSNDKLSWPMLREAIAISRDLQCEPGVAARLALDIEPTMTARWLGMVAAVPPCSTSMGAASRLRCKSVRDRLSLSTFNLAWAQGADLRPAQRDAELGALLEPHSLPMAA